MAELTDNPQITTNDLLQLVSDVTEYLADEDSNHEYFMLHDSGYTEEEAREILAKVDSGDYYSIPEDVSDHIWITRCKLVDWFAQEAARKDKESLITE